MVDYRRRVLDGTLDALQSHLRALSIHGPKAVGKTATAMRRAASISAFPATGAELVADRLQRGRVATGGEAVG